MRTGLVAAAITLALGGAALAQDETPAPAPVADTEAAAPAAEPAQAEPEIDTTPLAPSKPYTGECLPRLTPPGARCGVVGTSTFGADAGPNMSWQLYEIITGRQRSGLSVLFDGNQVIDTTVVPGEQLARWVRSPYVMASVVKRDDASYAVVAVPGDENPAAFSVHRADAGGWTALDTSALWQSVGARLHAVSGAQCYPITSEMNWRGFSLRYSMLSDEGNCGSAILGLGVEDGAVVITDAMAVRPDLTPQRRRRGRR